MTETLWLTATNFRPMLGHIQSTESLRKLRLFMCGLCRMFWDRIPIDRWRSVIDAAERFADNQATNDEIESGRAYLYRLVSRNDSEDARVFRARGAMNHRHQDAQIFSCCLSATTNEQGLRMLTRRTWVGGSLLKEMNLHVLLRDIFGNPFRPVSFDSTWRTSTAVSIAQQMYESRDFGAMPILADALQEAGCANDDVLNHCRSADGVHVRGCWVVDVVLGKS